MRHASCAMSSALFARATPIRVTATYAVFETPPEGDTRVFSTGRYLGRLSLDDGCVRFSELTVVYDTTLIPTSLIYPL